MSQQIVFLHSKLEMCLLVYQMFYFLFYLIILYTKGFPKFCIKQCEKFSMLEVEWREKTHVIHSLLLLPLLRGVCVWSLFCCAALCTLSSFAIILLRESGNCYTLSS